ncbi:MAG: hypothetical protein WA919_12095 [Coleofasciculaceae cyanobacterium]
MIQTLIDITGTLGWSSLVHSLIQGGIASIFGTPLIAAAFHPVTLGIGALAGLFFFGAGRMLSNHHSPVAKHHRSPEVSVISIEVVSVHLL